MAIQPFLTSESEARQGERQAVRALWRRIVPATLAGLFLAELFIPTCSVCGRIRDDTGVERGQGQWGKLESYVQRHSPARLSHTFCPECLVEYRRQHGLRPRA